jgi:hypothetical protein
MSFSNYNWDNKVYVLSRVSNDGLKLQYASDRLKNDKEIVLKAVSNYGLALRYASERLKNDKEVVLKAVSQNYSVFEYISNELKNDYIAMKEIFMLAIQTCYKNSYKILIWHEKNIYDCILSEKLKEELDYIKQLYNFVSYKQVCEYIKKTDEIKKYSYRIPMLDMKFRFI